MFTINKPKLRFNLILMDEGEYYFDDYSATLYPPGYASEEESWSKRVKGRILVCSSSIFFEPDEIKLPIMKFPFKEALSVERYNPSISPSTLSPTTRLLSLPSQINQITNPSFLSSKGEIFSIQTNQVIEMKENNYNKPYVFKNLKQVEYKFSLNYVGLEPILENMKALLKYSRQDKSDHDNVIKAIIDERENKLHFDLSLLVDINEKYVMEVHCSKVSPLVDNPGRLLLTNERLYFMAMNNIEEKSNQEYHLTSVVKILKRRHSLREIGLEIFFSDDTSLFFKFKTQFLRNQVYDVMVHNLCPHVSQSNEGSSYLLKWQNGVISNYDYLIYINSAAGRTFNDLTQYPVFPWIIQDYTSSTLDLERTEVFRDLTKPIGALNPTRLLSFQKRYNDTPDDQAKFLYGTHYSAPAYVLYYLVRQAPEYMLRLQNGKFDSPGRLFYSIEDTWDSVYKSSSDVKELIPEFYKPIDEKESNRNGGIRSGQFLLNTEKLNLGIRDDGNVINDVKLPPWAKSPEEFIELNRKALESEYVSQNLHHWIDLIFGYKQLGEEAIKANNLFFPLTYEGSIDIESVLDPHTREGYEIQINEFGQTPKQLFKNPHPPKLPLHLRNQNFEQSNTIPSSINNNNNINLELEITDIENSLNSLNFDNNINNNNQTNQNYSWGVQATILNLKPVNTIKSHKDKISSLILSSKADTIYSVSHDFLLKIYSLKDQKQLRSLNVCNMALSSLQLSKDEKHIVIGSWDNHIYIYSVGNGSISSSTSGHTDAVSCLKLWNNSLVTGSWDSSLKVWRIQKLGNTIQLEKSHIADFIESDSEIHSVEVSPNGMLCVAGSDDGTLFFYDLISFTLTKKLHLFDDKVSCIKFTPDGSRIVVSSIDGDIKLIGVEGSEIFSVSLNQEVNCLDTDGSLLIVGCEEGIKLWSLTNGLEVKSSSSFLDSSQSEPISAIHVTILNGRPIVLTGSINGNITIYQ